MAAPVAAGGGASVAESDSAAQASVLGRAQHSTLPAIDALRQRQRVSDAREMLRSAGIVASTGCGAARPHAVQKSNALRVRGAGCRLPGAVGAGGHDARVAGAAILARAAVWGRSAAARAASWRGGRGGRASATSDGGRGTAARAGVCASRAGQPSLPVGVHAKLVGLHHEVAAHDERRQRKQRGAECSRHGSVRARRAALDHHGSITVIAGASVRRCTRPWPNPLVPDPLAQAARYDR
jgi:hypothetical protein